MTILRILTDSPAVAKAAARAIYLRGLYQATSSGVYVSTDAPSAVINDAIARARTTAASSGKCTISAEYEERIARGVKQFRAYTLAPSVLVTRWYTSRLSAERSMARLCEAFVAARQSA